MFVKPGFVCCNREKVSLKWPIPTKCVQCVRYNRVFVITEFVITEFDCSLTILARLLCIIWELYLRYCNTFAKLLILFTRTNVILTWKIPRHTVNPSLNGVLSTYLKKQSWTRIDDDFVFTVRSYSR